MVILTSGTTARIRDVDGLGSTKILALGGWCVHRAEVVFDEARVNASIRRNLYQAI